MTRDFAEGPATFVPDQNHYSQHTNDTYRYRTPRHGRKMAAELDALRSASPFRYRQDTVCRPTSAAYQPYGPPHTQAEIYCDRSQEDYWRRDHHMATYSESTSYGDARPAGNQRQASRRDSGVDYNHIARVPMAALPNPPYHPVTTSIFDPAPFAGHNTAIDPSFRSGTGTTNISPMRHQYTSLTYPGVPIKGAASVDFTKTTMPKNFPQPLTCFYWYTHGNCTKTEEECIYAHHYTGLVAAAPVGKGCKGAVAGRNALREISVRAESERERNERDRQLKERDRELKEWESRLVAKEMQLNGKKIKTATPIKNEADGQSINVGCDKNKTAAESAREELLLRRGEIAGLMPKLIAVSDIETCNLVLSALDGAIAAVADM